MTSTYGTFRRSRRPSRAARTPEPRPAKGSVPTAGFPRPGLLVLRVAEPHPRRAARLPVMLRRPVGHHRISPSARRMRTARPRTRLGSVKLKVLTGDVGVTASITDVRCAVVLPTCGAANTAAGPDYIGELRASVVLRRSDKFDSTGEPLSATVGDVLARVHLRLRRNRRRRRVPRAASPPRRTRSSRDP